MELGIDLGGTNLRLGLVENGNIVDLTVCPSIPKECSYDESVGYLVDAVCKVFVPEIKGIGIGIPSVVDSRSGIVYDVMNIPQWKEVPLKEILSNAFKGVEVSVNNDSNCFALGEARFGKGRGVSTMVGITLGTGVGSGIVIDGKLYSGHNTGAGEIGCLPYLDKTLEDYCASKFFRDNYGMSPKETADLARQGHRDMQTAWNHFGKHIAMLIEAAMYAYDPEMIIFGGGLAASHDLYEASMNEELMGFAYQKSLANLRIEYSELKDVAILGAASLVTNNSR